MTKDFEALKRRVVAAGGKLVLTEQGWEMDIGDKSYILFYECDPNAEGIAFWHTYLDGRAAPEKARRCVDEAQAAILYAEGEDVVPASVIRREFGIEEAK